MKRGLKVVAAMGVGAVLGGVLLGGGRSATPPGGYGLHDEKRPRPAAVTPGEGPQEMAKPPSDAVVLFDGKNLLKWRNGRGGAAGWRVDAAGGFVESGRGQGGIVTADRFEDFQLHLEFATPAEVKGTGQGRGNSGVLINGMYEIQILDSFENPTYADGMCAAMYGQWPPLVNASRKPGEWQTYDLVFETPRWNEAGELVKKAAVTLVWNGVVVHLRREFTGPTDGIGPTKYNTVGVYKRHEPGATIELQDHANPVRFRNVWVRKVGGRDQ